MEDEMRHQLMVGACACLLTVAGTSTLAAPAQTPKPGQMTEAHVWVHNRGRNEAVPVELLTVNLDRPLRVQVVNGEPQDVSINPMRVRFARVEWEYQTITIPPGAQSSMAAMLNAQGAQGWETTGIVFEAENRTTLLLKRPR